MNDEKIKELEIIANELMRNPKVRTIQCEQGETLVKMLQEPENFRNVFLIFNTSANRYLQYLCINSLLPNISSEWRYLNNEEKKFLFESLVSKLFIVDDRPGYLILAHCKFLSRVYRLGLIELDCIKKLIERVLNFTLEGPSHMKLANRFFIELIQEINESIKLRSIVLNKKTAIRFRDDALGTILDYSIRNIMNLAHSIETLIDNLNILSLSLCFDFSGTSNEEVEDEPSILSIPLAWKPFLFNPDLFTSIEKMFQIRNEEIIFILFKVVNQLCGVRKTLFVKSEEKEVYCNMIFGIIQMIMQSYIRDPGFCENSSCLELFLQGIKRFLLGFSIKELSERQSFFDFLDLLTEFSLRLFDSNTFVASQNSIQVWSNLSYDGLGQNKKLKPYITNIFSQYANISYQKLDPQVFSSSNEASFEDLLDHLSLFSTHIYPEILEILMPILTQVFNSITSSYPLIGHISWSVYICSCMISNTSKKSGLNQDDQLVESMSSTIPKVMHLGGIVEKSIIYFCKSFISVYLCSSMENYWGDSDSLLSQNTLNEISMTVLEVIFSCFARYKDGEVLQKAIELFKIICSGYYSNKVITSLPSAFSLINYPVCSFQSAKLRTSLFFSLTELWAADACNLTQFFQLLTSKIQNSKHEILEIQNLFVELLGISKALNNEKLFIEFFEIIHAEIWEVLRVLKEGKAGFAVFKHVMKFFIELTENRNSRIKFEVNEPYGLVLFRSLADLVSIYCSFPESNENQVNSRVKVLLRLVNNLLRGGYICYGVFEIYNDPCYVNTIIICFQEILKTCEIQVNLI